MYWYKNLPDRPAYEDLKYRDSFSAKISRTFIEFFILLFLAVSGFVLFSGINYVDVSNQCFIRIKYDVLKGNRDTIVEAIEYLRASDFIFYRRFCANVNAIYEKDCVLGVENSHKVAPIDSKGCYIKGSHAILIDPMTGSSPAILEARKEAIRKYGYMAIDYWNNINVTEIDYTGN